MKGPDLPTFLWTVSGVIAAVLLPVLVESVRDGFPAAAAAGGFPPWLRKYLMLFAFAVVVALVSLAAYMSTNPTKKIEWFTAFLIGFGWEAAIEKVLGAPVT